MFFACGLFLFLFFVFLWSAQIWSSEAFVLLDVSVTVPQAVVGQTGPDSIRAASLFLFLFCFFPLGVCVGVCVL